MTSGVRTHPDPDPASSLDYLADLVSDQQRLRDWLRDCDPQVRQPFTHAMLIMSALHTDSGLSAARLLDELRCRRRSPQRLRTLDAEHLELCIAFLRWVLALMLLAPDDRYLRRAVLSAASSLYADAGDLDGCRAVMRSPLGLYDPITPLGLIQIGEVGPAFRWARVALLGHFPERACSLRDDHLAFGRAHAASATLDALLRYSNRHDDHAFGTPRALALLAHVSECPKCASEYLARARRLKLEPAEIVVEAGGETPSHWPR